MTDEKLEDIMLDVRDCYVWDLDEWRKIDTQEARDYLKQGLDWEVSHFGDLFLEPVEEGDAHQTGESVS